jgi:TolB protein
MGVPDTIEQGGDTSEMAGEVDRILRRNLELSGFFDVMDEDFFFDPAEEGMSAADINFSNWLNVGAQALVKSGIRQSGDSYTLDLRLYGVGEASQIDLDWSATNVSNAEEVRQQVNEFINAVVEHFTGEPGVFGSRIAFARRYSSDLKHIYVMEMDGSNMRRISRDENIHLIPTFGGNGDIYFTNYRDNNPDLFVYRNGSMERLSRTQGQNSGVSYCDGKAAVTMSRGSTQTDIYLIDPQTGEVQEQLTNTWAIDVSPTFSPDCSQIAFVSSRSGGAHIFVMDADGGNQRRLTFQGTFNTTPDWSPRGDRVVFSGRDERMQYDLFTVDLDNNIERLTQDQGNNFEPAFSPDGRYIVFASDREDGRRIWMMTSDGLVQHQLTPDGAGYTEPAWER